MLHRFIELARRAMDALGLDYQIVFPTPMLTLGMHPQDDIEAALGGAYNKWLVERILPEDDRLKGLLYLPFNTPEACVEQVERYADIDSVIGYTVCSTRNKPVHHNSYMKLYRADGGDRQAVRVPLRLQLERPVVPAAQSLHLDARAVVRALQPDPHDQLDHQRHAGALSEAEGAVGGERARLDSRILMQRLDHEYQMRSCEAPLLKRLPSEYMRDMFYTSQPMEKTNPKLLQATMEAFNAETQLLYASDWPHWDFDAPSTITTLPFLSRAGQAQHPRAQRRARLQSRGQAQAPEGQRRAGGAAGRVLMAVPVQARRAALGGDFVEAAERALCSANSSRSPMPSSSG